MDKHWTKWTATDHAKYNAEQARLKLEAARFNGFKTAAEHEAAMSELYASLNAACGTRVI